MQYCTLKLLRIVLEGHYGSDSSQYKYSDLEWAFNIYSDYMKLNRAWWPNRQSTGLMCGRSWVQTPVELSQLILVAS